MGCSSVDLGVFNWQKWTFL